MSFEKKSELKPRNRSLKTIPDNILKNNNILNGKYSF